MRQSHKILYGDFWTFLTDCVDSVPVIVVIGRLHPARIPIHAMVSKRSADKLIQCSIIVLMLALVPRSELSSSSSDVSSVYSSFDLDLRFPANGISSADVDTAYSDK